jgi:hypothetical protein
LAVNYPDEDIDLIAARDEYLIDLLTYIQRESNPFIKNCLVAIAAHGSGGRILCNALQIHANSIIKLDPGEYVDGYTGDDDGDGMEIHPRYQYRSSREYANTFSLTHKTRDETQVEDMPNAGDLV